MHLPRPPWIVGHRGAAGEAPENTLESFALAVEQGADMIELDVQLTADGKLAVAHDHLLRLGGKELRPEETAYHALAAPQPDPFGRAASIPLLENVLAALPPAFPVNIELKRQRASRAGLVAAIAPFAGRSNTVISSFDWELLRELRSQAPGSALAPLADRQVGAEDLLAVAEQLRAWSVHVAADLPAAALRELVRRHRTVLCYTVNDAAQARRLFDSGISGVFSDFPGRLRRSRALSTLPQFH